MSAAGDRWVRPGHLYVVAKPIGNIADLSPRAAAVLAEVDRIAAEDTRSARRLLEAHGIRTPCLSVHDHNERERVPGLIAALRDGQSLALISDAGTPLVSDPGFVLVRAAREAGVPVRAVPGPCAAVAALSVAGLPSDRFSFEGFLPARPAARRRALEDLRRESRTMVFYESPHRIVESVRELAEVFGASRRACLAREISKQFEQSHAAPLAELLDWLAADEDRRRGEFVIVVEGHRGAADDTEALRVAGILAEELGPAAAARLAARITGAPRNRLYRALQTRDLEADG